jgi:hypothetical protein
VLLIVIVFFIDFFIDFFVFSTLLLFLGHSTFDLANIFTE